MTVKEAADFVLLVVIIAFLMVGIIGMHMDIFGSQERPPVDNSIRKVGRFYLGTQNTATKHNPSFSDLLDAIEWVESSGDPNAVGSNGEAGLYQISEIYVDDVCRMLGENKYTYADRWARNKSRTMAAVYLRYYEENSAIKYPYYRAGAGWRNSCDLQTPFERMARIHNGGPNGYKKAATKDYWRKVKERMESK